jgi:hypothetical protein
VDAQACKREPCETKADDKTNLLRHGTNLVTANSESEHGNETDYDKAAPDHGQRKRIFCASRQPAARGTNPFKYVV